MAETKTLLPTGARRQATYPPLITAMLAPKTIRVGGFKVISYNYSNYLLLIIA